MHAAEWQGRRQRIYTKLNSSNPQRKVIRWDAGLKVFQSTCRAAFGQGDDFVQKITGNPNVNCARNSLFASNGERVRVRCRFRIRPSCIREFRNRPNPKVVVTVDMLSTGVDIPALEFIVFLRPVKSRILTMLGRGTRKCPEINKTKFTVFDCFDGTLIEYFKNTTDFEIQPPTKTPLTLPQVIENIWQNVDRDYHVRILAKRLRRIEKDMSGELSLLVAQPNEAIAA